MERQSYRARQINPCLNDPADHLYFSGTAPSPGRPPAHRFPAAGGTRKIVLATSIAETSLTIDGVRVVVDGGLARARELLGWVPARSSLEVQLSDAWNWMRKTQAN